MLPYPALPTFRTSERLPMGLENSCSPRSNTSIKNQTASLNISNRQSCSRPLCSAQLRTALTLLRGHLPYMTKHHKGCPTCNTSGNLPDVTNHHQGCPTCNTNGHLPDVTNHHKGCPTCNTSGNLPDMTNHHQRLSHL